MQSVSVIVPRLVLNRPPPAAGRVAADGAVGQRGRAAIVVQAAARSRPELPLMVQPVIVIVPRLVLNRPPPGRRRSCR